MIGPDTLTARISGDCIGSARVGEEEVVLNTCRKIVAAVFLLAVLTGHGFAAGEKEKAAEDAVVPWLALVDSGQYGESWFQASSDFRGTASKEQWIDALKTVRAPLGKVESRQLKSATYTTKLPNARLGEYVVLQ